MDILVKLFSILTIGFGEAVYKVSYIGTLGSHVFDRSSLFLLYLAQGHNAVPRVRIKPATPRLRQALYH